MDIACKQFLSCSEKCHRCGLPFLPLGSHVGRQYTRTCHRLVLTIPLSRAILTLFIRTSLVVFLLSIHSPRLSSFFPFQLFFILCFRPTFHSGRSTLVDRRQGSTIMFCIHWPGGPVNFKSYWPAKKVTGPNFFVVGIYIYSDKNRYIVQ